MTASISTRLRIVVFAALLGVAACSLFQPSGRSAPLTDRDVAAIFLAANYTDVSYARVALAPGRTTNQDVVAFANRMLSDHEGLNKAALDLFASTGLVPRDHPISLDFRDESAAKRDTLREKSGPAFDSTYMASEVHYHTRLLAAIDSVLLPATRNTELKAMLTRVRPAVAAHLEHATRIQAGLPR
jgi:putative membrane protein